MLATDSLVKVGIMQKSPNFSIIFFTLLLVVRFFSQNLSSSYTSQRDVTIRNKDETSGLRPRLSRLTRMGYSLSSFAGGCP